MSRAILRTSKTANLQFFSDGIFLIFRKKGTEYAYKISGDDGILRFPGVSGIQIRINKTVQIEIISLKGLLQPVLKLLLFDIFYSMVLNKLKSFFSI